MAMATELAQRRITISPDTATGTKLLRGAAVVYGERSLDLGGFVEVIDPRAAERTLTEGIDVRMLYDHDPGRPLGRLSAGTLKLIPTSRSLNFEVEPPEHEAGVIASVERRDIDGASFGFVVLRDEWTMANGQATRTVVDARIRELSLVVWLAYEGTHVTTRSMDERIVHGTAALERRPAREARDTERARAVRDEFVRSYEAAGRPRDFTMTYSYDHAAPSPALGAEHRADTPRVPRARPYTVTERLAHMQARARFLAIEERQRARDRQLEREAWARREQTAPPPRDLTARLRWMKRRMRSWSL